MESNQDFSATKTALEVCREIDLRHPCYCEENVWRLAYRRLRASSEGTTEYRVVFISNELKCCPFFFQKAAKSQLEPCYWDYHVILVSSTTNSTITEEIFSGKEKCQHQVLNFDDAVGNVHGATHEVLDMDSWLPFPCPLTRYVRDTFGIKQEGSVVEYAPKQFAPKFS